MIRPWTFGYDDVTLRLMTPDKKEERRQGRHSFTLKNIEGDTRDRLVCNSCGWIHYENPKIVVGAVCTWDDRILLCKRAIEPRRGYWTLPAGYLEAHETPEQGAAREAWEEAEAEIAIRNLLAVYSIARISQVQLIYRAELVSPDVAAGVESEEVGLFSWDDIPHDDLSFPSVHWALAQFQAVKDLEEFVPFSNPAGQTGDY